jgi:hypothetical protein
MRRRESARPSKDRLDLEALEATIGQHGWKLIADRVTQTIRQTERKLRVCAPEDLRPLQREIETLELLLRIPELLTQEIRKRCP